MDAMNRLWLDCKSNLLRLRDERWLSDFDVQVIDAALSRLTALAVSEQCEECAHQPLLFANGRNGESIACRLA